jgi:hypothetical protein
VVVAGEQVAGVVVVFAKVGVSSRGELVHKVFAEHYAPPQH